MQHEPPENTQAPVATLPAGPRDSGHTLTAMQSESVRLDAIPDGLDLDVVELGARTGMLWSRHGMALAGVGEALRIPIDRPGGAQQAQASLAELAGPNDLEVAGAGPVAFAALPFERQSAGELIVPQVVVGADPAGNQWMTATGLSTSEAYQQIQAVLDASSTEPQPTSFELTSAITPEAWRDEVVAPIRDRIVTGEFNKVVLARELRLQTDQPIDISAVLRRLHQGFGTAIIFAVEGFVGALSLIHI